MLPLPSPVPAHRFGREKRLQKEKCSQCSRSASLVGKMNVLSWFKFREQAWMRYLNVCRGQNHITGGKSELSSKT